MKKNVFFALFAVVALVFASCEPAVEAKDYTVKLSATELTMELAGQHKLTAVVDPATTAYPIVFTSSNTEVATVNASGIVEAVGFGTATITATLNVPEGDASVASVTPATCVVNVTNDAVLNNFALGGFALFNLGAGIPGTDTTLTISIGEVPVQLAMGTYYVWDEGIVLSPDGYLGGDGFMMEVLAPTYIITEGDYAGYYIGSADMIIDTIPEDAGVMAYVAEAGRMVDEKMYGDAWKAFLTLTNESPKEEIQAAIELYDNSQVGTHLFYINFETEQESDYYGNVSYAYILENEDGTLSYDVKIEWYDNVNPARLYGLLVEVEYDEQGYEIPVAIVEPYDMRYIHKAYNNMPVEEPEEDEEAAAAKVMPKKVMNIKNAPKKDINNLRSFYVK